MNTMRYVAVVGVLTLTGCNTLRGAPEPPFKTAHVWTDDSVKTLVLNLANPASNTSTADDLCKQSRNLNASQLIAFVDVNYMHYRQGFVFDRQHTQAASTSLKLMMTAAGGLTSSRGVKDNYLAGIGLLTGGEALYDKTYLFEKTAPALVSQMDASRKLRLSELLTKLQGLECPDYPGQVVLSDIIDYYYKGTVVGAISATQKDAEAKDAVAQKTLKLLEENMLQKANSP